MKNDDRLVEIPDEDSFRRLYALDRGRIVERRSRGTRVLLSSATRLSFGCRRRFRIRVIASIW